MRNIILAISLNLSLMVPIAEAKDFIIALSPYREPVNAETEAKALLTFAIEHGQPGDQFTFIDAYHLDTIATIAFPEDERSQSPKARIRKNRQAISELISFGQRSAQSDTVTHAAALLPQLTGFVRDNVLASKDAALIIVGSPFYDNTAEPQLNMTTGRIPSDGYLHAQRVESPFSVMGLTDTLDGLKVHLVHPPGIFTYGDTQHHLVKRFWSLYWQQQGAELLSFTNDLDVVKTKLANGSTRRSPRLYEMDLASKLEMIQLRRETDANAVSILKREITTQPLNPADIHRADRVEIGLTWSCPSCDLDLYAVPYPGADVLYYGNTSTAQGLYWKDFTNSPQATNGQEVIQFNVPIDLRVLRIYVGFYNGHAPGGVDGEVRLSVNGWTYAMPFHLDAEQGRQGAGMRATLRTGKPSGNHVISVLPTAITRTRL